jgi:hypothetical protein
VLETSGLLDSSDNDWPFTADRTTDKLVPEISHKDLKPGSATSEFIQTSIKWWPMHDHNSRTKPVTHELNNNSYEQPRKPVDVEPEPDASITDEFQLAEKLTKTLTWLKLLVSIRKFQ